MEWFCVQAGDQVMVLKTLKAAQEVCKKLENKNLKAKIDTLKQETMEEYLQSKKRKTIIFGGEKRCQN